MAPARRASSKPSTSRPPRAAFAPPRSPTACTTAPAPSTCRRMSRPTNAPRSKSVAWTAAAEAEVLVGTPKARRRFLDRGLVGIHPAALELLGRYREALRQKRGLLLGNDAGAAGLEIWNELLGATAAGV